MARMRRWLWLGLCAVLAGSGCNVLSLPFFLAGPEPSKPAEFMRIAPDEKDKDKDKKVRAAVLVSSELEVRDSLARVDRDLAALVTKQLNALCKANEEKVTVLAQPKVNRYKEEHPNWDHPLDLVAVGEDLKVDYVIYLDITAMTLYEKGSNKQFYHGNAEITVTLANVKKPDDEPEVKYFIHEYPESPISTFDISNPLVFRQQFLEDVAKHLTWQFTSHPTADGYGAK